MSYSKHGDPTMDNMVIDITDSLGDTIADLKMLTIKKRGKDYIGNSSQKVLNKLSRTLNKLLDIAYVVHNRAEDYLEIRKAQSLSGKKSAAKRKYTRRQK